MVAVAEAGSNQYKNVYGLTGSIACGKTAVANIFQKLGIPVIDLDRISREVVKRGSKGLKKIVTIFGKEFLTASNELDRKKLSNLIFANSNARKELEKILHPLIFEEEQKRVFNHKKNNPEKPLIIDAALMIETGSYKRYEKIIVVFVPEETQLKRLIQREKISKKEALKKIKTQMPAKEKIKFADYVIDNSRDLAYTEQQVVKITEEITCC